MRSALRDSRRRVVFVHPSPGGGDLFDKLAQSDLPPLGALYAARRLLDAGHAVSVFDLNREGERERFMREWPSMDADVLAFGTLAPCADSILKLAGWARGAAKRPATILAGGNDATVRPRVWADTNLFDAVIVGESDTTIARVVESAPEIAAQPGVMPRGADVPPLPAPIRADDAPFPARRLVALKAYRGGPAYKRRRHSTSIYTHRGCAYTCTFCEQGSEAGPMRFRSAASILDEVREIRRDHGIHDIRFIDDVFMIHKRITRDFCELALSEGERFDWMCCSRMDLMDADLLKLMRRAGCYRIELGVESGNDRVLDFTKKGANVRQAFDAMKNARAAGIEVIANYILGFPTETESEMRETIDTSIAVDSDFAIYFIFRPFAGAKMTRDLDLSWDTGADNFRDASPHYRLSTEGVQALVDEAYGRFYFRPRFVLKRLFVRRTWWVNLELARLSILHLWRRAKSWIRPFPSPRIGSAQV
ncbi:B12-binding domain-containing radical SAM protein [bacterium]|nr:B12-binding domain-containing radical SAM protein [bacterium]